jgi:hypothetical protein
MRRPLTRTGWIILALVIANEIRGVIVIATIAPVLWKAIG